MFDWDDAGEFFTVVLFIGLALLVVFGMKGCVAELNRQRAVEDAWCEKHSVPHTELEIFARIMNVSTADVINSEGLQAEFERFERGDLRQVGQETIHHGKTSETRNVFH